MPKKSPEIANHLAELRQKRGYSAAELARMTGVSRQTIYAIEANNYIPNTVLALKLAKALDTPVDSLFVLTEAPAPEPRTEAATLLPGAELHAAGQRVQLCRVDNRLIASPPPPIPWYLPAGDAVLVTKSKVQLFDAAAEFSKRILIAGCDPAISVVAHHARAAGIELVVAHRNSSQALKLLESGNVHVAGYHVADWKPGPGIAVISFALWEEGIVTAAGNPKKIRKLEDLARVSIVNREPGAGARKLLDDRLAHLGLAPDLIHGYETTAPGHLAAAWQVYSGAADACIATCAAARSFGLDFIPLATERYDFAIHNAHLNLPEVQSLFDILARAAFRRELESLGGYDAQAAGVRLF